MRQVTDATVPSYLFRLPAEVVRTRVPVRSSGRLGGEFRDVQRQVSTIPGSLW